MIGHAPPRPTHRYGKDTFSFRNEFIHGDFFRRLARQSSPAQGTDIAELPAVEFDFLRMQTRALCLVFACIMHLGSCLPELVRHDTSIQSVQDAVERAVMDVELRTMVQDCCKPILQSMPISAWVLHAT